MRTYCLLALRQMQTGVFEAIIGGPGISTSGVLYWFGTEQEAHTFLENLNFSYNEAKHLASWRKQGRKNERGSFRSPEPVLAR